MKKTITWALVTIALLAVLTGCKKEDEDDSISMDDVNKGVEIKQGKGGKEYAVVDLGMGFTVLWATCNLGATSPEQSGYYFAWGETEVSKEQYVWSNYAHCNGDQSSINKYTLEPDYSSTGLPDNKKSLESVDDAATQIMGDKWCIPSRDNFDELFMRCDYKCCKLNDIWGYLFTSRDNKNSIFIPLSGMNDTRITHSGKYGFYWSKNLYDEDKDIKTLNAVTLELLKESNPICAYQSREIGLPIRPVYTE